MTASEYLAPSPLEGNTEELKSPVVHAGIVAALVAVMTSVHPPSSVVMSQKALKPAMDHAPSGSIQ